VSERRYGEAGVWFIRIGFGDWILLDPAHVGEFIRVWNFGCYLVPLGVLELYLRAEDEAGPEGGSPWRALCSC
jgi:hypothetical protein